jgi:hypothetical protein
MWQYNEIAPRPKKKKKKKAPQKLGEKKCWLSLEITNIF